MAIPWGCRDYPGSPVYSFNDVTPEMKAPKDLTGFASRVKGRMFGDKVGVAVVAVLRPGAVHPLDSMDHFFLSEPIGNALIK